MPEKAGHPIYNFWQGPRVVGPQLLNTALPEDAEASLADLIRLNRWLGGHRVICYLLRQVVGRDQSFSLLDVGAASGDAGRMICRRYPRARVTSLDCNPRNLQWACAPKLVGDAFSLPFADGSFDFVFSSLFLHHFSEVQVEALLREFARVARRAVLISDVERHQLARWFLPATRWLCGWNWLTVHDGSVSVRSAFTRTELLGLARKAELRNIDVAVHRPAFRLSMVGLTRR
jgi:2-polyprenyl-3-methyl-5-hydroxy-6-metoxy-1,4-benzoquinol methylase